MRPPHRAAMILAVLIVAGVLGAAALAGDSDARPFAVQGSLDCPLFDIGQPISEEERRYGAEYRQRAAKQFIDARTSMASAARAELEVFGVLRRFDDVVSGADRVITGTVVAQRLGYLGTQPYPRYGLVSTLDGTDVRLIHRIAPACQDGASVILGYWPLTPALEPGRRYAIVVGPQQSDGTREALLAYELDGIKITEFWPTGDSPIGGGSVLAHLIDSIGD